LNAIRKAEVDKEEAVKVAAEAAAAKGKKPDKKEDVSPRKSKDGKDSAKGKKSKSSGVEDNALSNDNEGLSEPEVQTESQIMIVEKVEEVQE